MHDLWTSPTTNMIYTRSQNNTNMGDGKHGIQTFEVVVDVLLLLLLLFDVLSPQVHIPYYIWTKWFVQIYLNVNQVSSVYILVCKIFLSILIPSVIWLHFSQLVARCVT